MIVVIKKRKIIIALLIMVMIVGCVLLVNKIVKTQTDNNISYNQFSQAQYRNCVAGLLRNSNGGSSFVVYDTETWNPTVLLNLPDVSSRNFSAISSDGNYIAYTKWDQNNQRGYLEIYSFTDGETKSFYQDMPTRHDITKISWLPDNKTLLLVRSDRTVGTYQEIRTLNIETGEENTLVKGEVWRIRTVEDIGTTAKDFYLKGHEIYLKVKEKKPIASYDPENPINPDEEWNYYLDQNDLNEIYHCYGGVGTFDIEKVINLMYVRLSPPRCSKDGTKILYSALLFRNSAPGSRTPLWMQGAIWVYDVNSGQASIVYSQTDGGAIGRVDWIDDDEICFVSYYDWQGSRDSINYFNLSTKEHRVLFPYTDENYNNVTLLPVGNRKITFTTSKKNDFYENSKTILFDIDTNTYSELNVKFEYKSVLLENFTYVELLSDSIP